MAKETGMKINVGIYDKKHLNNLLKATENQIKLLDDAVKDASRIGETSGFKDKGKPFFFDDYPVVKARIDELLQELHKNMVTSIEEGNKEEWLLSCEKNDKMVDSIVLSSGLSKAQISQWKQPNLSALNAFQSRKVEGMGLSARVWNITDQLKEELELALDIGLGEGKSAAALSRDVRKFLKEPDKLFRRVRDKHGVLRLSKAAKAYHPGQGVYRSSYKNAMRLASTEINMAYRSADYERWQQLPFVVGTEIRLSNNHTINGVPFYDICDELKGKYPKDFKFVGWHPKCRCYAVPVLPELDDFIKYQNAKLAGEDVSNWKFDGAIKDVPENFKEWMKNNEERLGRAKSIPYFIKDNPKYTGVAPRMGASSRYSGTKLGRSATKAAYKEYENASPISLSKEQSLNIREIAGEMGIKVTPMSFFDADSGRGNVNFGRGKAFRENCQCCIAVHEARLRGLNITSLGYNKDKSSVQWLLGEHFESIWINPRTGKMPVVQNIVGRNDESILSNLEKQMQVKGRYHIGLNYKDGRGHVITAEKTASGKTFYYDAQSGEFINIREYTALESIELLKIDKLIFNGDMLKAISAVLE